MRTLLIAIAGMALVASAGAGAQQRVVARGPGAGFGAGGHAAMRPMPPQMGHVQGRPQIGGGQIGAGQIGAGRGGRPMVGPSRWGSKVGGHWWGGVNAPGGWNAYRRPARGWALPTYWNSPRFYVSDWSVYGLSQPSYGYNWVRYYDDAVLIDARGSVYDAASGINWDGYADGDYTDEDAVYAGAEERGDYYRDERGYDERRDYDARRDNGVGGAVTGAVVGGVAGNVIAGRGNRLGGTLIGAGVGAAAGYAIDKSEDHRRAPPRPAPGYGAGYAQPGYGQSGYAVPVAPERAPPPPPPPQGPGGPGWRSADGSTTVTTTTGGGYARGGYYYPGATTTTVVVQTAPVVTTTTTEIYEDTVTYTRAPAVRKKTKRVWRPAPKCLCR